MLSQSKHLTAAMRSVHARSFFSFLKGGGGNTSPPASLEGKVCWVVGGVDTVSGGAQSSLHDAFAAWRGGAKKDSLVDCTQVGRNLVRGLLDAGAMVVVNSRTASRLEHLAETLGQPDRLATVHGSLLPENADKTISNVMNLTAQRLDHVVAHAGVRWWAGRGKCDETNTLAKDRLFTINDEDFPQKACQLAALQFSAARRLLPRLDENGSYTFVVGDGADDKRSALGAINLRACQGIAAACRHEAIIACKVNEVKVQVAAAPGDEASFLAGLGSLTAGVAGAEAAAAVEVSEAGLAALRASYPARDDLGGSEPVQQAA